MAAWRLLARSRIFGQVDKGQDCPAGPDSLSFPSWAEVYSFIMHHAGWMRGPSVAENGEGLSAAGAGRGAYLPRIPRTSEHYEEMYGTKEGVGTERHDLWEPQTY